MAGGNPEIAEFVQDLLGSRLAGGELGVRIEAHDGSAAGPDDARTTIVIDNDDALNHLVFGGSGDIGFARAYVSGAMDVDGDLMSVVTLADHRRDIKLAPRHLQTLARILGRNARRLPPPPLESRRFSGLSLRSSRSGDPRHDGVSNRFFELVLGESLSYSCALWERSEWTLDTAQSAADELAVRKLGLQPGDRLLDIDCGWGSLLIHAAQHFGVSGVGITTDSTRAQLARRRVDAAGMSELVEIREQHDLAVPEVGEFDAVSATSMFSRVGSERASDGFATINTTLRAAGRVVVNLVSSPDSARRSLVKPDFIRAYVIPGGDLAVQGAATDEMQRNGLEIRHVESLREHHAPTLEVWLRNLERNWSECVAEVGASRARLWRLYLAGAAVNFSSGELQMHQILATKEADHGRSGFPPRADWHAKRLDRFGG